MSSKLLNYPSASTNPHLAPTTAPTSTTTGSSSSRTTNGNRTNGQPSQSSLTGSASATGQLNFENLQLDDILCTVCQSVLVEPVFLPCQHRFCRNCLSGTIEKNNLNCPCCRKRFGTWYRNASRVNKLVHEQLWNAIQSQFRDYLEEETGSGGSGSGARCNGNGSVGGCFMPRTENVIHLSEPGEIRKEYETELQRYHKELIEEKKKELAASEKYIINLYKQEGIIDLVDSSDHLSISSSTSTPEQSQDQLPEQDHESSLESRVVKNKHGPVSVPTEKLPVSSQDSEIHEVEDDDDDDDEDDEAAAGPSGSSSFPQSIQGQGSSSTLGQQPQQNPKSTFTATTVASAGVSSSNNANASRPETSKTISNGSVISISSTSSASAASSSCISSASSRYSLNKSANAPTTNQRQQPQKMTATSSGTGASGSYKSTVSGMRKIFTMAEVNKSELCVKPTKLHRRSSTSQAEKTGHEGKGGDAAEDDDDDDGDSLRSELNHFKPIIATAPKSCFSSKAIVRVPSIRPQVGSSNERCLKSPAAGKSLVDPTTPRRSAFCVVNINLFTPPSAATIKLPTATTLASTVARRVPQRQSTGSGGPASRKTPSKKAPVKPKSAKPSPPKAKNNSKRRNPQKRRKALLTQKEANPTAPEVEECSKANRVTRQSMNRDAERLRELIVDDQQRREAMIEQERRDFEFARKLQRKLNRARERYFSGRLNFGLPAGFVPQEAPARSTHASSFYTLRTKGFPATEPVPCFQQPSSSSSQSSSVRKRKLTGGASSSSSSNNSSNSSSSSNCSSGNSIGNNSSCSNSQNVTEQPIEETDMAPPPPIKVKMEVIDEAETSGSTLLRRSSRNKPH